MQTVVVGAGPAGLVTAMALARHGHQVTVVDRDPGPGGGRPWERKGVMQFHQPHMFRSLTRMLLAERLPDVFEAVVDAGAELYRPAGAPDEASVLRCRRETFERTLRLCAMADPRVDVLRGHAERLLRDGGRITGLVIDGRVLFTDLVVDATGRHPRLSADVRPPASGGDCGFAYASRMYRLRPVADPGPQNAALGYVTMALGYQVLVFVHDDRTFSVLLVRDSRDRDLAELRHEHLWDAAMATLEVTRAWTDRRRSRAIGPVRPGAGLTNHYQGQSRDVLGLLFAGDSVCTTNPVGARGASLALLQAFALADVVAGQPFADWAAALDDWGELELRPWYDDAVALDAATHRLWDGVPIDPEGPVTPDLVIAAVQADPRLGAAVAPYATMLAGPDTLTAAHPRVRELLRRGWRPPAPAGPTRDELVAVLRRSARVAVGGEEVPQQRRGLPGEHAAEHLGPVVEPAVTHHVPQ